MQRWGSIRTEIRCVLPRYPQESTAKEKQTVFISEVQYMCSSSLFDILRISPSRRSRAPHLAILAFLLHNALDLCIRSGCD